MSWDAKPLVVVIGPTASGKSTLAEGLAASFAGEVISADALQLYRGLDVGTAKPTAEVRARIPHHCVDVLAATERCSAGEYGKLARAAINGTWQRGALAVLVGGSGFYVHATLFGLDRLPRSDPEWRRALESVLARRGSVALHGMLARLDPEWAGQLADRDGQRILRALEVVLRTGRRRAQLTGGAKPGLAGAADALWVGVTWPRPELWARIEQRVDRMLEAGWLAEVEQLLAAGVPAEAHALQAIGYRDLVEHLAGNVSLKQARERIIVATRQYAKRQLTWFRRVPGVTWWELSERPAGPGAEDLHAHVEAEVRARSRR